MEKKNGCQSSQKIKNMKKEARQKLAEYGPGIGARKEYPLMPKPLPPKEKGE